MARRKPLVRPVGHLTARDAVWQVLRAHHRSDPDAGLTAAQIVEKSRTTRDVAREFLKLLVAAGIAEKRPGDPVPTPTPATYRLVRDLGVETPRIRADGTLDQTPTDQERMWAAIKALGAFTWTDVQLATGIANVQTIRSYLVHLARAGYFATIEKGGARRPTRWRLLPSRNTGPRPPAIRRGKAVFDPNLGRQVWPQPEGGAR